MLVRDLLDAIDHRMPLSRAAEWDPVGLQIGWPEGPIGSVGVCHEPNASAVTEAIDAGIGTLVSYHPLLFSPTTRLVFGPTAEGRAMELVDAHINLIVVHTAFDAADPGTGDFLLRALGMAPSRRFGPVGEDPTSEIGRIGRLAAPSDAGTLAAKVREVLGVAPKVASAGRPIESVAVVPGSGSSMLPVIRGLADALITGDVGHHAARDAADLGVTVIDAGHAGTERPGIEGLYSEVCEVMPDAVMVSDDPSPWGEMTWNS